MARIYSMTDTLFSNKKKTLQTLHTMDILDKAIIIEDQNGNVANLHLTFCIQTHSKLLKYKITPITTNSHQQIRAYNSFWKFEVTDTNNWRKLNNWRYFMKKLQNKNIRCLYGNSLLANEWRFFFYPQRLCDFCLNCGFFFVKIFYEELSK